MVVMILETVAHLGNEMSNTLPIKLGKIPNTVDISILL